VATTPVRLLEQARTAYALDALDEALRLGSAAASLGGGADAHALVGNIHMKRSSLDEAERAYRAALAADPKHPIATERLTRVRALREQRTGARP
jgi:Tfp pilus assembly protein PilF